MTLEKALPDWIEAEVLPPDRGALLYFIGGCLTPFLEARRPLDGSSCFPSLVISPVD